MALTDEERKRRDAERTRARRATNPELAREKDRNRIRIYDKEKGAEKSRAWRAKNPERNLELERARELRNKEKRTQQKHDRYVAHAAEVNAKAMDRYHRNPERAAELGRKRYLENPLKKKQSVQRYRESNRTKANIWFQNRRARKANAEGTYTAEEWEHLCAQVRLSMFAV